MPFHSIKRSVFTMIVFPCYNVRLEQTYPHNKNKIRIYDSMNKIRCDSCKQQKQLN